jgi:mono/diheme cytochrome c family protein
MKTTNSVTLLVALCAVFSFAFQSKAQDAKPWAVPESANKMKNPLKSDAENISVGKALYAKHCRSCHGKAGEGDGTKAAELATFPGDFTASSFQSQSDGAIYFKTVKGRDDMPAFEKKIPDDEDVWAIVIYLRELGK